MYILYIFLSTEQLWAVYKAQKSSTRNARQLMFGLFSDVARTISKLCFAKV